MLLLAAVLVGCGGNVSHRPRSDSVGSIAPLSAVPDASPSSIPAAATAVVSASASTSLPTSPSRAAPTRIVVASLGIDLPIVPAPAGPDSYPYCNVAMYLPQLHVPAEPGATYVFAHARTGMFLPLLDESRIRDGARLIGVHVDLYTSDDRHREYAIKSVHRHVLDLSDAIDERDAALYLQTSEGPHGTPQKLQVRATPVSAGPATEADARPTPHPVACE